MVQAIVYGSNGPALSADERAFYREADPYGFIVFKRNCVDRAQLKRLISDMRDAVGREAPVLVDQEGGRVVRLDEPTWWRPPSAARIGEVWERDPETAISVARSAAAIIAADLADVGITTNCLPVLDLRHPGVHDVIGNRAFSVDVDVVTALGQAQCEGMLSGGVLPVIKHLPGHGRTRVDSHLELPRIDADHETLSKTDFEPFRRLSNHLLGMVGHCLYPAIDPAEPASRSTLILRDVVRGEIGFEGLLFTDDLSMEALSGTIGERVSRTVAAGCDIAVHCNGQPAEMESAANAATPMTPRAIERADAAARAQDAARRARENIDLVASKAFVAETLAVAPAGA